MGEFAPREEVAEALGAVEEEEEDSSSTPGKEDVEDGRATSIFQIADGPARQPKFLPVDMQLSRSRPFLKARALY